MKKIYEYSDYRSPIADYYAERKAREAFTWRDFAKNAGFSSPVYLKQVSEGRFNLSDDAAERVARAMEFEDGDVQYYVLLVRFNHAKKDSEKRALLTQMFAIAKSHKVKILEGDAFKFFDDWKNSVVRELAPSMPGAKPLDMAHACRPKVSAAEISDVLAFLLKADILKKDENGNYKENDFKAINKIFCVSSEDLVNWTDHGPMQIAGVDCTGCGVCVNQCPGKKGVKALSMVNPDELKKAGIKVEVDDRNEKLGYKVRDSIMHKVPFTIIIGQNEVDNNRLSYRLNNSEEVIDIISKTFAFKGEAVPFVMELPNYRMPSSKSVLQLLWEKAKDF